MTCTIILLYLWFHYQSFKKFKYIIMILLFVINFFYFIIYHLILVKMWFHFMYFSQTI